MSVRVAIVGCGGVSRRHVEGFKKVEDVAFVGMCDLVEEKAKSHTAQYDPTPSPPATGLDGLRELESHAGYVAASKMQEWLNLRQHWGEV